MFHTHPHMHTNTHERVIRENDSNDTHFVYSLANKHILFPL